MLTITAFFLWIIFWLMAMAAFYIAEEMETVGSEVGVFASMASGCISGTASVGMLITWLVRLFS